MNVGQRERHESLLSDRSWMKRTVDSEIAKTIVQVGNGQLAAPVQNDCTLYECVGRWDSNGPCYVIPGGRL